MNERHQSFSNKLKIYWNCIRLHRNISSLSNDSSIDESIDNLLDLKDFLWNYVLPIICFFGVITNSINVFLFSKRKNYFHHKIYIYLHGHTICQLFYLLLTFNYFLFKLYLSSLEKMHRITSQHSRKVKKGQPASFMTQKRTLLAWLYQ